MRGATTCGTSSLRVVWSPTGASSLSAMRPMRTRHAGCSARGTDAPSWGCSWRFMTGSRTETLLRAFRLGLSLVCGRNVPW
eukprot:6937376-Prymnesium_polylepis.1